MSPPPIPMPPSAWACPTSGAGRRTRHWQTLWRYDPPFKYYLRQSVVGKWVERLQGSRDVDREATIRLFEEAKDRGQELQDRIDAENNAFRNCPMCDDGIGPGWWR